MEQAGKTFCIHCIDPHAPVVEFAGKRVCDPCRGESAEVFFVSCHNSLKEVSHPKFPGQGAGMIQGTSVLLHEPFAPCIGEFGEQDLFYPGLDAEWAQIRSEVTGSRSPSPLNGPTA